MQAQAIQVVQIPCFNCFDTTRWRLEVWLHEEYPQLICYRLGCQERRSLSLREVNQKKDSAQERTQSLHTLLIKLELTPQHQEAVARWILSQLV